MTVFPAPFCLLKVVACLDARYDVTQFGISKLPINASAFYVREAAK
jgi:hypothetical protein